MPHIRLNAGTSFKAEPGTSILDAAAAASRLIPYSCRTGRCSTCRCKVVEGETLALAAETGLSPEEQAEGWILGCVRSAVTDLTLEVDTLDGLALPPARTFPCRIASIERLAPDVVRILLRLPPTATFEFLPGQYLELIGPGGIRRSYSLATTGSPGAPLELHVREVPAGVMSDYLFHHARDNDLLRLHGPLGTFVLRDVAGIDLILLATGTGIAPVKAILESLPSLHPAEVPRSVTVLWGGRIPSDLYLDIAALPGTHRFIPVLSRADGEWTGARGHVQDVLLALQPDLRAAAVYACGSDAMIHGARDALLQAGLPAVRFHSDAFVCSAAPTINQGQ
ncbi:MAG TPA: 2Fe-2S iron-sulfur cluster-binding protein [Thermomonas sp.]|nr:2Fe-2S iron-sulfur cluster-binding protein [Thermomonas sp.]